MNRQAIWSMFTCKFSNRVPWTSHRIASESTNSSSRLQDTNHCQAHDKLAFTVNNDTSCCWKSQPNWTRIHKPFHNEIRKAPNDSAAPLECIWPQMTIPRRFHNFLLKSLEFTSFRSGFWWPSSDWNEIGLLKFPDLNSYRMLEKRFKSFRSVIKLSGQMKFSSPSSPRKRHNENLLKCYEAPSHPLLSKGCQLNFACWVLREEVKWFSLFESFFEWVANDFILHWKPSTDYSFHRKIRATHK